MQNEIFRFQIQYSKLFTHSILCPYANKFLKIILLKHIEFINNEGLPTSVLVLAHYRPDLVCKDLHPIINRCGVAYGLIDRFAELEMSPVYGQLYKKYYDFV